MKTITQEIQEAYKMYSSKDFQYWWCMNNERLKENEKNNIKRAFNVGGTEAYEQSSEDYYTSTFNNQ